jgi:hypothetical protein
VQLTASAHPATTLQPAVAVAIEHTEGRVVTTLLCRPLFGALDDTDGSGPLRVVRDHHLGGGQVIVYACRFEVFLLGLPLAHDQRNRARLALAGMSPERRLASYFGDVTTGHALTAELSNHGNRPVAPLHVPAFQCFVLARPVVEQWIQMSRLLHVFFDEPDLIAA